MKTTNNNNNKIVSQVCSMDKKKVKSNNRRRNCRKQRNSYAVPIFRVLQQIDPNMRISKQAINIVDCFVKDMFERLAGEAALIMKQSKRKTMSSLDVEGATKLVLNGGELTKHAVHVGASAVVRFFNSICVKNDLITNNVQ